MKHERVMEESGETPFLYIRRRNNRIAFLGDSHWLYRALKVDEGCAHGVDTGRFTSTRTAAHRALGVHSCTAIQRKSEI